MTPFEQFWIEYRDAVVHEPVANAIAIAHRASRIYTSSAFRKRIRKLPSTERCKLPPHMWFDIAEAVEEPAMAYQIGQVRWALDEISGAIDAFRSAVTLSGGHGEWALADSLLWAGKRHEASALLERIAGQPGVYSSFAKVLLDHELGKSDVATIADYQKAHAEAESVFGDGPSRRNFAVALVDYLESAGEMMSALSVRKAETRRGNIRLRG